MIRLLLDEHISPSVAKGLRRRHKTVFVRSMTEWEEGSFLGQPDEICLTQAALQRLTLVTYDRRTIPPLLKTWAEQDRRYGGVLFVDEKTISPADIGSLVHALIRLIQSEGSRSWWDKVVFLSR